LPCREPEGSLPSSSESMAGRTNLVDRIVILYISDVYFNIIYAFTHRFQVFCSFQFFPFFLASYFIKSTKSNLPSLYHRYPPANQIL
jgi:hypothetical protein